MSEIRRILVTGAAGGVGRVMCRRLMEAGCEVTALARPEDPIGIIPLPDTSIIVGYVQDSPTVKRAVNGVDAVVHCAALLPHSLHLGHKAFQEVNVGGTRTVLLQAGLHGVSHVICFSTISVVDHVTRTILPADLFDFISDTADPYLCSKIAAERALMDKSLSFAGHLAVIRPSFVYGPGNYAVWEEALELTRNRKMRLVGRGDALLPLIYAEDIANYVLAIFQNFAPPSNKRYDLHVVSNPQPTTMRQVFDFIADCMNVPRPPSVPSLPLKLAAELVRWLPDSMRKGRLKLLTRARVMQYSRGYDLSHVLDLSRLASIGMTDYKSGLSAMLDDFLKLPAVRP